MGKLADELRDGCCNNGLLDKQGLMVRIGQLEMHNAALQAEVDENNRLRAHKEAFAHKCFRAGYYSDKNRSQNRAWLDFKAMEL